jgi:putative membrane protein
LRGENSFYAVKRHMTARQWFPGFVTILALSGLTACGGTDLEVGASSPVLNLPERMFLLEAQEIHATQTEIARIAKERSQNADVRRHAETVTKNHQAAVSRLSGIIDKYEMSHSQSIPPLTQVEIDRLSQRAGLEFDREFVTLMLRYHRSAYYLFEDRSSSLPPGDPQEYAKEVLPAMEEHVLDSEGLRDRLYDQR